MTTFYLRVDVDVETGAVDIAPASSTPPKATKAPKAASSDPVAQALARHAQPAHRRELLTTFLAQAAERYGATVRTPRGKSGEDPRYLWLYLPGRSASVAGVYLSTGRVHVMVPDPDAAAPRHPRFEVAANRVRRTGAREPFALTTLLQTPEDIEAVFKIIDEIEVLS